MFNDDTRPSGHISCPGNAQVFIFVSNDRHSQVNQDHLFHPHGIFFYFRRKCSSTLSYWQPINSEHKIVVVDESLQMLIIYADGKYK